MLEKVRMLSDVTYNYTNLCMLEFLWHVIRKPSHFGKINLHPLEAKITSNLNIIVLDTLWHIRHELGSVQFLI